MDFLHFFDSLEKKKRLSHIKALLELAAADNEVADCEIDLIAQIGLRIGLTHEETNRIFQHPETITFVVPESLEERLLLFYDYICVMLADKVIHPNEQQFCTNTAAKLAFPEELRVPLITRAITGIQEKESLQTTLTALFAILDQKAL